MDNVSKVIRNLEYQKKYFENIFKEYGEINEIAITKIDEDKSENNYKKVMIFCENYRDVLNKIFHFKINETNINHWECSDKIVIEKSYSRNQEISFEEKKVYIFLNHLYTLSGMKIELIKKIKKEDLKDTAVIIANQKIKLFDRKYINDMGINCIEIKEIEHLKDYLFTYKPEYNIWGFIEKNVKEVEPNLERNFKYSIDFKIFKGFDYIENFLEAKLDTDISKGLKKIKEENKSLFIKEINKFLESRLNGEFEKNYNEVDIVLKEYNKLNEELGLEGEKIYRKISEMSKNLSQTAKYLELSKCGIEKLYEITSEKINEVFLKINN